MPLRLPRTPASSIRPIAQRTPNMIRNRSVTLNDLDDSKRAGSPDQDDPQLIPVRLPGTPEHTPTVKGFDKHWEPPHRDWIYALERPDTDGKERLRQNRTIVMCFDGTGDSFDNDNSNVVHLMSMLRKGDNNKQVTYYQPGIGTYTSPLLATTLVRNTAKTLDEMFAWNLGSHVKSGYHFLMQTYRKGDKICIFGFSRGAYTARALAGMLQKVGLLPANNYEQLSFAYNMYKKDNEDGYVMSREFKAAFSIPVEIEFVGVWDTVASVGLIPRYLPFATTNTAIRYFRHAVALDEHRIKFMPNFYHPSDDTGTVNLSGVPDSTGPTKMHREHSEAYMQAQKDNEATGNRTRAKEVMFAGVHCDVGGGSVLNGTRHSLAKIPLRWMIRECFRTNTGIIFDEHKLRKLGLDVDRLKEGDMSSPSLDMNNAAHRRLAETHALLANDTLPSLWQTVRRFFSPKVTPGDRTVCKICNDKEDVHVEAVEDFHDALCPTYDQLPRAFFWKLMEWLPMVTKLQKDIVEENNQVVFTINRGRGRKLFRYVMKRHLLVHQAVRHRLHARSEDGKAGAYVPLVRPHPSFHIDKASNPAPKPSALRSCLRALRNIIPAPFRPIFKSDPAVRKTHQQWVSGSPKDQTAMPGSYPAPDAWFFWDNYDPKDREYMSKYYG